MTCFAVFMSELKSEMWECHQQQRATEDRLQIVAWFVSVSGPPSG